MLTKTKIIVASLLVLGSASAARAEDPEADIYHVQRPAIGRYSDQYVLPNASVPDRQLNWRKRSNSH
jgi:hypothetical protein